MLEMTEELEGNTLTCGNFFTSYPLAEVLLKKKIAMVGTIRKNKPEQLAIILQTQQRQPRFLVFVF